MTDTSTISSGVRREIQDACEGLVRQFVFLGDSRQHDKWLDLFTEDGEMAFFGQSQPNKGRAALRTALESIPDATIVHVVTSHHVDVLSEDAAEGVAYNTVFIGPPSADGPLVMSQISPTVIGVYRDVYARTSSGWKFAKRAFEPLVVTGEILELIKYTDDIGK